MNPETLTDVDLMHFAILRDTIEVEECIDSTHTLIMTRYFTVEERFDGDLTHKISKAEYTKDSVWLYNWDGEVYFLDSSDTATFWQQQFSDTIPDSIATSYGYIGMLDTSTSTCCKVQ